MTHSRGRTWILGVVSTGVVLTVVALTVVLAKSSQKAEGAVQVSSVSASVTTPSGLNGVGEPVALTPAPTGSGVWFLEAGTTSTVLSEWDGTRTQQYSLGNPASNGQLRLGVQAAITFTSDGSVWVGLNSTLLKVAIPSGQVSTWQIPPPCDNQMADLTRPSFVHGYHAVTSMSINSSGVIAIATSAANCVVTFNTNTNGFGSLQLPPGHEPLELAYGASGSLAVATAVWSQNPTSGAYTAVDNNVDVMFPDGTSTAVAAPSVTVTGGRNGSFLVTGAQGLVTALTAARVSGAWMSSASPLVAPMGSMLEVGVPAYALQNGSDIAATTHGFVALNSSGQRELALQLGSFDCSSASVAPSPPGLRKNATSQVTTLCPEHPAGFAVDGNGNIWFYASGVGLGEISASTYASQV